MDALRLDRNRRGGRGFVWNGAVIERAYMATAGRSLPIARVATSRSSCQTCIVAGEPFVEELIGPSSGAWSRRPGEYGKIAYFISDGGTASPPPDGGRRQARLLRVELPELPRAFCT